MPLSCKYTAWGVDTTIAIAEAPEDPMTAMLAKIRKGDVHLKKVPTVSNVQSRFCIC